MTGFNHGARSVRTARDSARRALAARLPVLFALAALAAAALPACGKKGPPLAPLVRLPAGADRVSARRLGDTAYIEFSVPGRNQDNSMPADITRVEVYGFTGTPANDADLLKRGTLVARIPVRKPPEDDEAPAKGDTAKSQTAQTPPAKSPSQASKTGAPAAPPGVDQGAALTVAETLTPALLMPLPPPPEVQKAAPPPAPAKATPAAPPLPPMRVYVAVGFNHKGRRGAMSRRAAVPVQNAPASPSDLKIACTETQITLNWAAPETPAPTAQEEPAATAAKSAVAPLQYNVYAVPVLAKEGKPEPAATPLAPPLTVAPVPLNQAPLQTATFTDPRLEFGVERCYEVRTVAAAGGGHLESAASQVACVTPVDTFAPAAPKGLTAVTSAGAISLLWEPNTEGDLGGYLVLRGEAPGVKLQPVTTEPIHETTFNDTTVKPGVRYVYAIVAVDRAGNISAQSNRVEETGR
jgi:hypothetical protein